MKETCPECGKELGSKSALTQHISKEHGKSPLTKLMADHGIYAPRPGGAWRPNRPLRAAPSGVPSIDYAIGIGGVPRGCILEIFGPPSSGKTNVALTFSAYAQQHGGLCGYADAEHRFQETMAKLLPGLNLDALYFSGPPDGETALNQARDFIQTGLFDVWTIDSVHGCVPKSMKSKDIGDPATRAALAQLMSVGCQVLDAVVADTNTVLIFVNHVKSIPGVVYGREWSKPGGSALDYYASVQLNVRPIAVFHDSEGRKIGQTVKVKVENSKVAAPHATAEYDLFLAPGKIKISGEKNKEYDGRVVVPGIDISSCWFSVCQEVGLISSSGGRWALTETGESLGTKREVMEMLQEDCDLRQQAEALVYSEFATDSKAEAVT